MTNLSSFFRQNRAALLTLLGLVLLPFIAGLFEGVSPAGVWVNAGGTSKFIQGLAIEIFILALYALSFDLIFGITGLLSFGHSMFFAVGAYLTGIMLKSFGLNLWQTIGVVFLAAIAQALLFGMGELHLDIIVDRLAREFGVRANTGRPQVAYKESLRKAATGRAEYARQARERERCVDQGH